MRKRPETQRAGYIGHSALSEAEKEAVRRRYYVEQHTKQQLAADFHVSRTTVQRIVEHTPLPAGAPSYRCAICRKRIPRPRRVNTTALCASPICKRAQARARYQVRRRIEQVRHPRQCAVCKAVFTRGRRDRIYCSRRCYSLAYSQRRREGKVQHRAA